MLFYLFIDYNCQYIIILNGVCAFFVVKKLPCMRYINTSKGVLILCANRSTFVISRKEKIIENKTIKALRQ